MQLTSPAFSQNQIIPEPYTCVGNGDLPDLRIAGVPEQAKSLAITLIDPDAPKGDYVHWLAWNIPPTTTHIAQTMFPSEMLQGRNDATTIGYVPPCPPYGTHRYIFTLYALDSTLDLPQGSSRADLENAIRPHYIDAVTLTGVVVAKQQNA